jgi:hypothetical protein
MQLLRALHMSFGVVDPDLAELVRGDFLRARRGVLQVLHGFEGGVDLGHGGEHGCVLFDAPLEDDGVDDAEEGADDVEDEPDEGDGVCGSA